MSTTATIDRPSRPRPDFVDRLAGVTTFTVEEFADPLLAVYGHDPRGGYVRRFWLPLCGPGTIAVASTLLDGLCDHPDGYATSLADVAALCGLGAHRNGKHSTVNRTVARVCHFGFAELHTNAATPRLLVRAYWPPLAQRQLHRLPAELVAVHPAAPVREAVA